MPARVAVRFGPPIWPSGDVGADGERSGAEEFTLDILKAIAEIAGQTNIKPRLAGPHWKPTEKEVEAAASAQDQRRATVRTH